MKETLKVQLLWLLSHCCYD